MKLYLKRAGRFILRYWLAISMGMILTVKAVGLAYEERGYIAFGGEYFVLPVTILAAYLLDQIIPAVLMFILDKEVYDDSRSNSTENDKDYKRISETDGNV